MPDQRHESHHERRWTKDRLIASRLRQCLGKVKYPTPEAAIEAGAQKGVVLRAYRCAVCGSFHQTKFLFGDSERIA